LKDRTVLRELGLRPSRLGLRGLVRESALSVLRNGGRSLLTTVGTVLGAASFVVTLGLGSTLGRQVSDSFDLRRATEVRIEAGPGVGRSWHGDDRLTRVDDLNGVVAAGWRVMPFEVGLTRLPNGAPVNIQLMGADPRAIAVMGPHLVAGRSFDWFHELKQQRVIMLARPAADRLGVTRVGGAVFLGDLPFTVIGIYDAIDRRPEAMLGGMVPASVLAEQAPDAPTDVLIATVPGAAALIASQAPIMLWPEQPAALRAIAPPDPRNLRQEIEGSVTRSSLILSVVALLIGAVSIANSATGAIQARTAEIGLRRAVGGRPSHIFAQLLGETTALGALGGFLGACLGITVVATICLWNGWTPVLDVRVAAVAVGASAVTGLLAGLWPARGATRIQPVSALQQ
jgi:putative ABC transport system permease protein